MAKKKRRQTCKDCAYFEYRKRKGNDVGYCAAAGKTVNQNMAACQFRVARHGRE